MKLNRITQRNMNFPCTASVTSGMHADFVENACKAHVYDTKPIKSLSWTERELLIMHSDVSFLLYYFS